MRLLQYNNDSEFNLTEFVDDIPPYAILSHTWGPEEVTFGDITDGNGTRYRSCSQVGSEPVTRESRDAAQPDICVLHMAQIRRKFQF